MAWLASRLGMGVVSPLAPGPGGSRTAILRQGDHAVSVEWRPARSELGAGSTVRVEIVSRHGEAELAGIVTADDHVVQVVVRDRGRERVRRIYAAPRLTEVELLGRAMDDRSGDLIAAETLATAGRLLAGTARQDPERGKG